MSDLLSSAAVGSKTGGDAAEILQAYIATTPAMVLSHSLEAQATAQPKGTGAGDQFEPK